MNLIARILPEQVMRGDSVQAAGIQVRDLPEELFIVLYALQLRFCHRPLRTNGSPAGLPPVYYSQFITC